MAKLTEQVGYIRGLIASMELEQDSPNAKLLAALADALENVAGELGDLRDDMTELNDFVESIDEDLEDLEATVDGDARDAYADEEDDFDGEDDLDDLDAHYAAESGLRVLTSEGKGEEGSVPLAGSVCSECGKVFFVPLSEIKEENELYTCPHCHKPVDFTPLGPDNAPIAKPYRE